MATSQAEVNTVNDVTVCPICFEKFKIPRYLQCKHSFCHDCLSSYIVSQCNSTGPRLGFHCPLCRVYIPCDGNPEKPEEWAGLFPINDILQKIVNEPNEKRCEACVRDGDEEEAFDFCLSCIEYLCKLCAKYHKKNLATRDHIIISVDEMKSMQVVPNANAGNRCPKHQHEHIQLYCHDHEQPCCGLCGGTEHRKCEKVDTIENVAHILRESGQMESLLKDVNAFKEKLQTAKTKQEQNISDIENTIDKNVARTEEEFLNLVKHLEKLKKEHVDSMFSTLKKSKEMLQREIEKIVDGVCCVDSCKTGIEDAQETWNNTESVLKFVIAKEKFQKVKQINFRHLYLDISEVKEPAWIEVPKLKRVADVSLSASSQVFDLNIKTIELTKFHDFKIKGGCAYCGSFLSDGNFLIANHNVIGTCLLYNDHWECFQVIEGLQKPYDAIQYEEELFVTNTDSRSVEVFSLTDYRKLRSLSLSYNVYGITSWNGYMYVACGTLIIKINIMGLIMKSYHVDGNNNLNIIATKSGLIVYSDWKLDTVNAMTDDGCFVWKYQTPELKQPIELETDSSENIYIASRKSNGIHVLAKNGEVIKILKNIRSPVFCKINEKKGIFCVCTERNTLQLYYM